MIVRLLCLLLPLLSLACSSAPKPASFIFLHPDGAGLAAWEAYRYLAVGPDGETEYDKLPEVAIYRGHMRDSLTASSNGGATAHATGVRVGYDSFGNDNGTSLPGSMARTHWMIEARDAGVPVGLVNSGVLTEPGTACFVTDVRSRGDHDEIARQLVASGAEVLLGGGERYFLPEGVAGRHGAGGRKDGRDLVAEARAAGYTVVFTREELANLPAGTRKVLGLFASGSTFNDMPEEAQAARGLPHYKPDAPTLAEMTRAAVGVLGAGGRRFALVVEEEGTDNFGNTNNAGGMLTALARADETIAYLRGYTASAAVPTLMVTTCDSEAGGMRAVGLGGGVPATLPTRDPNGAPVDGVTGTGSAPFLAAPDRTGRRLAFRVSWASRDDVSGGIAVKATGYRAAELVHGQMDNTDIARIAREALGLPQPPQAAQTATRTAAP